MKTKLKNESKKTKQYEKKLMYILAFLLPILIIGGYVIVRQITFDGDFFSNGKTF